MKVCIIGYGSIGKRHERILREYFGIEAKIVRRGDEIPSADIAMICTPTDTHIPIAIECAKWDMALFIEKPLSNSLDGLDELEQIVNEKKLPTYVAYPFRHHDLIKQNLWEIRSLRCLTNSYKWLSKRKLDHVLLELSHELDIAYMRWRDPSFEGKQIGDFAFYGRFGTMDISLNMRAEVERREVRTTENLFVFLQSDDLYARQFEWFIRDCDYSMMNNIGKARPLLEKILEIINANNNMHPGE